MTKLFITSIALIILLSLSIVSASEAEEITEGKKLIENKISCDSLTDDQQEAIGEYYMEQMHPGQAHELMEQMMGGKDSPQLKQIHELMTKRFYCNEDTPFGMGMMMGYSSGMMSGYNTKLAGGKTMMGFGNSGYRMMGSATGWWSIYTVLYTLLLLGLLVLVVLAIIWMWKKVNSNK